MAIGTGHGADITSGDLQGSHPITSIDLGQFTQAPINATHLLTGTHATYIRGDVFERDEWEVSMLFDTDATNPEPTYGSEATHRVTFPVRTAGNTAGYWEGNAAPVAFTLGRLFTGQLQECVTRMMWLAKPTFTKEVTP